MTNCANLSAPLAAALAPLVKGYRVGELSLEQPVDTGRMVCAAVGIVAAATAIGQAYIPVPVLGPLIGAVAGQVLSSILSREIQKSSDANSARVAEYTAALNARQKQVLDALLARFAQRDELTAAAFDIRLNAEILVASATLARTYGVEESKSTCDVDQFMLC